MEEDRIEAAVSRLGQVAIRYQSVIDGAAAATDDLSLTALGERLWRTAVEDVGVGNPDDRSLYWARLAIRREVRKLRPMQALGGFERASRGMTDTHFGEGDELRVLISGFDPFLLDEDISQSNPSGLAALSLDGARIETTVGLIRIEAVVMPVRFVDFDEGLVEAVFTPMLENGDLQLALTISMGRDAFDLERFPGRRRSAEVPDNLNVLTGASATQPQVPHLGDRLLDGPEFVEFGLPAGAMSALSGRWPVRDNRQISTLEKGEFSANSLNDLAGLTAVRGSGGGYLSNEISYRTVLLNQRLGTAVPIGHLHTPRVAGHDGVLEWEMVGQIRAVLVAGVEAVALAAQPEAQRTQ